MIDTYISGLGEREPYFDAMGYFADLTRRNKLCVANGFTPVACSGPMGLEGLVSEMQYTKNFVAVDDTNEGDALMSDGGYFKTTTFTVWILAKYDFNDMADRQEKLAMCRTIYLQFLRRMLRDKYKFAENFNYFMGERIATRELGAYFIGGLTGLEFHFNVSVPLDLCYNEEEFNDD